MAVIICQCDRGAPDGRRKSCLELCVIRRGSPLAPSPRSPWRSSSPARRPTMAAKPDRVEVTPPGTRRQGWRRRLPHRALPAPPSRPPPPRPRTASGSGPPRTTRARATAASTRSTPRTSRSSGSWTFSTGVVARPGSGAARGRQHDVHRDAVPQHRLRARPDQARRAGQVELRAEAAGGRAGRGLLRRREPRRRVRRRQDLLQHARRPHHRGRRRAPARRSGARRSATSTWARRSRWRRWW